MRHARAPKPNNAHTHEKIAHDLSGAASAPPRPSPLHHASHPAPLHLPWRRFSKEAIGEVRCAFARFFPRTYIVCLAIPCPCVLKGEGVGAGVGRRDLEMGPAVRHASAAPLRGWIQRRMLGAFAPPHGQCKNTLANKNKKQVFVCARVPRHTHARTHTHLPTRDTRTPIAPSTHSCARTHLRARTHQMMIPLGVLMDGRKHRCAQRERECIGGGGRSGGGRGRGAGRARRPLVGAG